MMGKDKLIKCAAVLLLGQLVGHRELLPPTVRNKKDYSRTENCRRPEDCLRAE